ncbi:MAG TPA: ABC transporter ATP-binding protein [Steroidobacteraceae bacterium]|nr:ABC transporter ATP-binding protein [Steroidobacteraceae bacterium]
MVSAVTSSNVVRLSRVTKTYRVGSTEVKALDDITLSIPSNRFSIVIGASGSGKTTLLNLVGCIDTPTDGAVQVCGEDVTELSDDKLADFRARNIGFIFQNFSLVPVLTAYENVEYPLMLVGVLPTQRRARTMAMLEAVGLAEHAHRFPNELSGGQKQRVAIARALVKRPTLVLADEPTANLDSSTGASIIALMRRIQAELKTTFIFASHDAQLISHADEIFAIRDGTLMERRTGTGQ